jgi:hypothetical protein
MHILKQASAATTTKLTQNPCEHAVEAACRTLEPTEKSLGELLAADYGIIPCVHASKIFYARLLGCSADESYETFW